MAGRGTPIGPRAGKLEAHILVVEAPYYEDVSKALAEGALAVLAAHGCTFERIVVPGALEIPQVIVQAAAAGRFDEEEDDQPFDGAIVLGCVIRGETSHYDIVAGESARGLMELAVQRGALIGNGILTCDNGEQARVRADPGGKDKGGGAVRAALSLLEIRSCLRT